MALPLPSVIPDTQAGGGAVTAFGGMNALNNALQQTRTNAAQAQYAPYQAYGNAFLTNQEALWTPYKYQTQALSNPFVWMAAQNNPALLDQLKKMASNLTFPNGSSSGGMPNIPQPNQSNSLFDMLMNKLRGGNPSGNSGNPISQPMGNQNQSPNAMIQPQGNQGSGVNSGYGYDAKGNNIPATPQEIDNAANRTPSAQGAGYNTPAGNAASGLAQAGGLNGANPLTAAEAGSEALKNTVTGQSQNQTAEQKASNDKINAQSGGAVQTLKALEGWYKYYKASTYKGQYAGTAPSSGPHSIPNMPGHNSSAEQLADNFSDQVLQLSTEMQPAGMTDDARALMSSAKGLSRNLDEDAAQVLYKSKKAGLERIIQSRKFADDFYKNNPGATQEQLVSMMNNYNRFAPSYDYENEKALPENDKKYKDFTSKKALDAYINDGIENPYENKNPKKPINPVTSKNKAVANADLGKNGQAVVEATAIDGDKHYAKIKGKWYLQ
jgi:hypothetical protein